MSAFNERLKNKRIVRRLYYFSKGIICRKKLFKQAENTLTYFEVDIPEEKKREIVLDMVKTYSKYGFDFSEYICFRFYEKPEKERIKFVADWEHLGYTCALNNFENAELFDNKWKTYLTYREYYGRKILFCDLNTKIDEFVSFLSENETIILKPLDASCGTGVQVIETRRIKSNSRDFFQELLDKYNGSFVVEELIIQAPEMAKFHACSVNTVRIPTIRMDDEVRIVNPFMRLGRGGNCVDNAGAGGIICSVDADSGKIFAAADEKARRFVNHPDSNEDIIGFVIPRWDEAKALVRELATVIPDNRYTGWDVALTADGWVLVEANRRGQFVWQIASQIGFREEIDDVLKKLDKKY